VLIARISDVRMSDDCMSDQQQVNAVHDSNRLPARLAVHFPVLSCQVVRIIEDQNSGVKTDAMLSLIDPVFSFVPGKFHNGPCVDEYVYTITHLSTAVHTVAGSSAVRGTPCGTSLGLYCALRWGPACAQLKVEAKQAEQSL